MSRYLHHDTLTPPRLAVLISVARGEHPEINRVRLRWYVQHGYLERSSAQGQPPAHRLTELGWRVTGLAPADGRALSGQTGYVAEPK